MTGHSPELALVTGAAGGIGSATCRAFLAAGFAVAGVDIEPTVTTSPAPGDYVGLVADVRDPDSMRAAIGSLPGPVSHLVTCAGIALLAETVNDAGVGLPDVATFRESVELNLTSHYISLDAVWPQLRDGSGNRSVGFASSINALQGFGMPAYSAAKAGLIGLVHALVVPLGRFGCESTRSHPVPSRRRAPGRSGRTCPRTSTTWLRSCHSARSEIPTTWRLRSCRWPAT